MRVLVDDYHLLVSVNVIRCNLRKYSSTYFAIEHEALLKLTFKLTLIKITRFNVTSMFSVFGLTIVCLRSPCRSLIINNFRYKQRIAKNFILP